MNLPIDLVPGSAYRRSDLHDALGGQRQGGISTPARYPVILLFSSHRGAEFGYEDGWNTLITTERGYRTGKANFEMVSFLDSAPKYA